MIRAKPEITIAEMADSIGKTTRAVEMQLAKLKQQDLLQRVGPDKGGRWIVKEQT